MEMSKPMRLSFGQQNPTSNNTDKFPLRRLEARSQGKMAFSDRHHRLPTLMLMILSSVFECAGPGYSYVIH